MKVRRLKPDELQHHGIKNQHWGVKNGPPYPLDKKTSAKIKKGHNEKLRDDKREGTAHYSSITGHNYRFPSSLNGSSQRFDKLYKDNESHLQETLVFTNPDGSKFHRNLLSEQMDVGKFVASNMKASGYNHLKLSDDKKRSLRSNGFSQNLELLKSVNSDEDSDELGSTMNNCSKCSDMVEMIMRGLDPSILSAGRTQYGMLQTATEYHWDGAIPYKEKSLTNIEKRVKSFGNHASGTLSIRRPDGSGHSMHFSRLKDGSIEVQDGQIAKTYSSIGDALNAEGHDFNQFCKITRLDCATPNIKHMAEDSVLRMDSTYASNYNFLPSVTRNDSHSYYNDKNTFTEWGKKNND